MGTEVLIEKIWMHFAQGQFEQCFLSARQYLHSDPYDRPGIRFLVTACLLHLGRWNELLEHLILIENQDPGRVEYNYPLALALYNRSKLATPFDDTELIEAKSGAIEANSHVPKLLSQMLPLKREPLFEPLFPECAWKSQEEALNYTLRDLRIWQSVPDAIDWISSP